MTVEAKTIATDYDRPASLDAPGAPRTLTHGNFEKWAWLFMRFSGLFLIILAIGHMFIMLVWDDGVHRIDASFVAARWQQPFWQIWDLTMLWLAQLHGANGLRTVIGDYSRKDRTRFWLNTVLLISVILVLVLGTYAILTFGSGS